MPTYRVKTTYHARCVVVLDAADEETAIVLAGEAADLGWGEQWADHVHEIESEMIDATAHRVVEELYEGEDEDDATSSNDEEGS